MSLDFPQFQQPTTVNLVPFYLLELGSLSTSVNSNPVPIQNITPIKEGLRNWVCFFPLNQIKYQT